MAVANEQLVLDGMPEPEFDTLGFSDDELARAQAKVDMTNAVIAKHPDLLAEARRLALMAADKRGHVGVRWLGEAVRLWLADKANDQLNNDVTSVLVRLLVRREPWLRGLFELRLCALDAVLAAGEAR